MLQQQILQSLSLSLWMTSISTTTKPGPQLLTAASQLVVLMSVDIETVSEKHPDMSDENPCASCSTFFILLSVSWNAQ